METPSDPRPPTRLKVARRFFFGPPKDLKDPGLFHKISLIAFLAWVGLGADGLSSSAYGPDESFRALTSRGPFGFLAVFLAAATALTVFVISRAYSRVIEHFPTGGGGYVVASKLLGSGAGVVSGSALLVDYILTITVSVASGGDALFSMLPVGLHAAKLPVEVAVLLGLVALNVRGVRESVNVLMPVFLVFVATHVVLIVGGVLSHIGRMDAVVSEVHDGLSRGVGTIGWGGLALIFLSAYTRGGGTYTGIEAVSNGLQIMRDPKVHTGKRTMVYMATSLAFTAGGILFCYLLFAISPQPGKTMNAVLVEAFAAGFRPFGLPVGWIFVVITLVSEGALLFVAAQTGFIDGPRVMATMAVDGWLPHRFSSLSDRLTAKDGITLMGGAATLLLLGTGGHVGRLVVMYAVNVFLTFSLTTLAMLKRSIGARKAEHNWAREAFIEAAGFVLCVAILVGTIAEKLFEGAWVTIVITSFLIAICVAVHTHYRGVAAKVRELDGVLAQVPTRDRGGGLPKPGEPTAVLMVGGYGGLGVHSLLQIRRTFGDYFKNFIFVSVGVVDSGTFKGRDELDALEASVRHGLERYVTLARRLGYDAAYRLATQVDPVDGITHLCLDIADEFPRVMFFAGKLLWKREAWYQRLLHNETALQVERRLQWKGLPVAVMPLRITDGEQLVRPVRRGPTRDPQPMQRTP
jgi:amino acid transporter